MIGMWPRSMLGRNLALLIPLVITSQICALALWLVFLQRPRIDEAASLIASQIMLADRLLALLPEAQRHQQLIDMDGIAVLPEGTRNNPLPQGGYVLNRFFDSLLERLPADVDVQWQVVPDRRLWVRLRTSDALWIPLATDGAQGLLGIGGILSLLVALTAFPTIGAYLIHRQVQEPLRRLARAALEIEGGAWPAAVPVKGPLELATVTEAFNRMTATLAESDASRAEMLAGISHDIRTPLTKLRMLAATPELFEASSASAERFIEEIDAIVGQFIDFARGAESEVPTPGDLNALATQLAADYAGLGHSFDLHLDALPELAYRPIALQRALLNLMQNAVVHGRTGLEVATRAEAGFVLVSVKDRGPGLPQASLSTMKQPFRRGARSLGKGAGLGLAIADRIARQHGGTVELALRRSGGLSATLRLPVQAI